MKRVLLLANHAITIFNFRLELVRRLISEGYEVHLSAPYSELIDEIVKENCIFHAVELERHGTNPLHECRLLADYKQLIKKVEPDIVFAYTIKPNIYGGMAAAKMDVPFVANITGLGSAVEQKKALCSLVFFLYKVAFRKVQTVFFQNQDNMRLFEKKKIAVGRHKLLPGSGVNLQHFYLQKYPEHEAVCFAFISRIMKEKGIDEYIDAARNIKKRYPDVQFDVCGFCEEEYEDALKALCEEGLLTYHGMVKDIREILVNVSCVVLPSYHEGMSNVLLEAAASGRPAIATDIPGCREIIRDGCGFLVKPHSAQDLAEKMNHFLSLSYAKRREMGLTARKQVEQYFDRKCVVDTYMKELPADGGVSVW